MNISAFIGQVLEYLVGDATANIHKPINVATPDGTYDIGSVQLNSDGSVTINVLESNDGRKE